MEALAVYSKNNSLLLTPKNRDLQATDSKGLYEFSLKTKEVATKPLFKIDLKDKAFTSNRKSDLQTVFRPSDMAAHPVFGELYILDGVVPQLLIMDVSGTLKDVYSFNEEFFPQPEGIAFSPDGSLFISNEGEKDVPATITQLKLN